MGAAAVVSLEEARRARPHAEARQRLHEHVDRWLDQVEHCMKEPPHLAFVVVTEGKRSDLTVALGLHVPVGSIGAIGCGYVELFLKAIQQNLRIKTFLGTCEHAVLTQVWVVLMTDLILAFLQFKAGLGLSFRQIVHFLQINLFERRKLIELCSPPPPHVSGTQLLWAV